MKTDNISAGDSIWTNNVDLLEDEGVFPVIGNCQISSILSNLDNSDDKIENHYPSEIQPEDIVPTENAELRDPLHIPVNIQNNYVVLKDSSSNNKLDNTKKATNLKSCSNNFENLLYFVCNLCPFLCIKNAKITEHLENAHKTKTTRKLPHLKCPACENVFFHKMSLRSHLIHDHGVGNSDINQIIQAIVYYANKSKANEANKNKQKSVPASKPESNFEVSVNSANVLPVNNAALKQVNLPKVEINQNNAEKMFNTMMNQPSTTLQMVGPKRCKRRCSVEGCKVTLMSLENMNLHISCHKDSAFVCSICSENFTLWKSLASHLWRLHKIDMELFSCDKCDYKSVSLAKLNNIHKLTHGDVKNYVCGICKKAFKNSKQLGNHKITHKRDCEKSKYRCEICSKNFSDKRQLKIHMNVVHEKLKPFLCNYCGYKGSSKSSLKMHIRQHTGEKPFSCDTCSYTTSDHNSLRRHKLRHTGQKPYKCSYCSYACIQSSTYKVHLKTKHPGQEKDLMFTCPECQFRSVNKEMFTAHMITMHNQQPQAD